jgi:hypothetical protein
VAGFEKRSGRFWEPCHFEPSSFEHLVTVTNRSAPAGAGFEKFAVIGFGKN